MSHDGDQSDVETGVVLTPAERRRRRARSIALALALGVLVVMFYTVTIVKLGSNVAQPPV